jgi:hypothetical protein
MVQGPIPVGGREGILTMSGSPANHVPEREPYQRSRKGHTGKKAERADERIKPFHERGLRSCVVCSTLSVLALQLSR